MGDVSQIEIFSIPLLNEHQIADFLKAIKGNKYKKMFLIALFTGIREGEVCGLQWECVDFSDGTILIDKQLQSLRSGVRGDKEKYALVPTKNGKIQSCHRKDEERPCRPDAGLSSSQ